MKKLLVTVAIAAIFAISYADMKSDSLAAHNDERNANGVPSLTWSDSLAQTAQAYAQVMANTGTTSHSKGRVNVGENLAWGKGKNVDTTFLAGLWLDEKEYYIPGVDFPDCSNTGSWHDVAHYTQLMWEETTEVGCGLAQSSSGMNYYVCHYSPQGNMDGEPVYTEAAPIISTPDETDPVTTDSATTDSTTTDPATTDSATVDPATADPVTADPTTTDPVATDPVATDPVTTDPTPTTTTQTDDSQDQFITDSLAAHNNERAAYGVPALTWSSSLAQTAQAYAEVQASTGTTSHSKGRVNVGENLAWGSGSGTTTLSLAGRWLAEKKYFIAGRDFPNCSTTGNWDSVAHYTQMMWRKTTQVGCGIAKSRSGMNYYVCHYSPQGNINGNPVY